MNRWLSTSMAQRAKVIAEEKKSPFFLYDQAGMQARTQAVQEALGDDLRVYYAMKANPNPEIVRDMLSWCSGLDISSGGEMACALQVGCPPGSLSFAGPGKGDLELGWAIRHETGSISVESVNELLRINRLARDMGQRANVALRVNPSRVFPAFAVKMGGRPCQFGIDEEDMALFFEALSGAEHCFFRGVHVYSGTQCLDVATLVDNFNNTLRIVENMMERFAVTPEVINFGGGFGVAYHANQTPLDAREVCRLFRRLFADFKVRIGFPGVVGIVELGRYLIAESGMYVAQIVDIKGSRGRKFCVLNGGMNHHLAASGNFGQVIRKNFPMVNLSAGSDSAMERVTVVGPLCTSLDLLGDQVDLAQPEIGHHVAILGSGAYGYTASPLLFLSHGAPMELLLERDGSVRVIREGLPLPVI